MQGSAPEVGVCGVEPCGDGALVTRGGVGGSGRDRLGALPLVLPADHRVEAHNPGMDDPAFVPPDFTAPTSLETPAFRLEPLGPQHNEADYAAWTSSIEHIRSTPGFPDGRWPDDRSFEDNLRDLRRHQDDFVHRRGFTYTVLDPASGDVIGCVYIYPDPAEAGRAQVQSWVRVSRAELDVPLWRAVSAWLEAAWPFASVAYAERRPA